MQITKEQKRMVGVLILAAFVTILNQTVVNPAIPSVMRDMHVGAATTQWLVSGFTLVNSILVPVTAYFSDRFPVRGLYIFSVASFILGSALCGWAVNFPMLLTGRITQAIGAGILMPLTMTVMMLVFPIEKRGTAMGFFGLVISFAPAIGPTVSGIVIDAASWRWLFRGIFVLALIILAASGFVTNKTAGGRKNQRLDIPSVILSTLGFGGVLYVLSSVTGTPLSWIELAVALVGIISLVSFFLRQLRLETPLLQIRVLKIRSFTISTIIGMLVQASLMSGVVLIPIYVQQMRGMPATVSGLLLLPGALLSAVINPIAGRFFDRNGARRLAVGGTIALTLTSIFFCFLDENTPILLIGTVFAIRMMALNTVNMPVTTWGMNALDNRIINHGTSVNNTFRQVAGSLGTGLIVSLSELITRSASAAQTTSEAHVHAQILGVNGAFIFSAVLAGISAILAIIYVRDNESAARIDSTKLPADAHELPYTPIPAEILLREVYTVPDTATVAEAVQIFDEKHISSAPIVNSTGHAVGLITESDVVRALSNRHHQYLDPIAAVIRSGVDDRKITEKLEHVLKLNVLELGRRHIITVPDRASLEDVARIMSEDRLTKLYVRATGNTNNGADSGTENGADKGANSGANSSADNAANSPVPSPAIAREQAANSRGVICGVINRSDLIRFALLKSHSTEVLSG